MLLHTNKTRGWYENTRNHPFDPTKTGELTPADLDDSLRAEAIDEELAKLAPQPPARTPEKNVGGTALMAADNLDELPVESDLPSN